MSSDKENVPPRQSERENDEVDQLTEVDHKLCATIFYLRIFLEGTETFKFSNALIVF